MNRAKTIVAAAVVATCGAWPLAVLAQAGGAGSGSGASGTDGGTTRYDTQPNTTKPTDAAPAQTAPAGSGMTSGSTTGSAGSTYGTTAAPATGTMEAPQTTTPTPGATTTDRTLTAPATGTASGTGTADTTQTPPSTSNTTGSTFSAPNTTGNTGSSATGTSSDAGSGATRAPAPTSGSTYGTTSGTASTGVTTPDSSYNTLGLGSSRMTDAEWERGRASSYSLLPMTSYGYVGANLGRSRWDTPCGMGYGCESGELAGKIYTGGLISRMVGLEIGYINLGQPDRAGGEWRAHGLNASIVANLPIEPVNLFARFGTTYGWTKARTGFGSGVMGGNDDGFGLSYGAGIGFDVTPRMQVTAEWDRNQFRFVTGRDDIDMYSLGLRYKF